MHFGFPLQGIFVVNSLSGVKPSQPTLAPSGQTGSHSSSVLQKPHRGAQLSPLTGLPGHHIVLEMM